MAAIVSSTVVAACGFPVAGKHKFSVISPSAPSLLAIRPARTVCSSAGKSDAKTYAPRLASLLTTAASTLAAATHPAVALVDERLSGEGTGLSLGVSNPLLLWILLGVSALIWSLYFAFSSTLPEGDDDSGLSL